MDPAGHRRFVSHVMRCCVLYMVSRKKQSKIIFAVTVRQTCAVILFARSLLRSAVIYIQTHRKTFRYISTVLITLANGTEIVIMSPIPMKFLFITISFVTWIDKIRKGSQKRCLRQHTTVQSHFNQSLFSFICALNFCLCNEKMIGKQTGDKHHQVC